MLFLLSKFRTRSIIDTKQQLLINKLHDMTKFIIIIIIIIVILEQAKAFFHTAWAASSKLDKPLSKQRLKNVIKHK